MSPASWCHDDLTLVSLGTTWTGRENLSAFLADFTHRRTLTPVCNCSVGIERRKKGQRVLSVQRSLMYVLYLEADGLVGVTSSHAESWRCGFIYVSREIKEKNKTLQNGLARVWKRSRRKCLNVNIFIYLPCELILREVNSAVLPGSDYVTDAEQRTIPWTSRGNLAFLSKWVCGGRGEGGKKQVAISTHQTYIQPLGRTGVASRFFFFCFPMRPPSRACPEFQNIIQICKCPQKDPWLKKDATLPQSAHSQTQQDEENWIISKAVGRM